MLGFHIDFNTAHFKPEYLYKWLKELSSLGYNTIIWELEDYVRWDICPQIASSEALSKVEFSKILDYSRSLGLKNIPLLQGLAHCEYVLKHKKYTSFSETPSSLDSYCPLKDEVHAFLENWIAEYLEIFYDSEYFHLGCDEAFNLGKECKKCLSYIRKNSKSKLVVYHINRLANILSKRNITPCIWADMLLIHNDAIKQLSHDVILFDWRYEIYKGNGKVWGWDEAGGRLYSKENIPEKIKTQFMNWLYPMGDEIARQPEPFYTSDYLKDMGFKVVTCPATSCYQDNVFAPRSYMHIANTFDSIRKGAELNGSVVTSWSIHLFPYELQYPALALAKYALKKKYYSIDDFETEFSNDFLGLNSKDFFVAAGKLSKNCLFSYASTLGYTKENIKPINNHISKTLKRLDKSGSIDDETINCIKRCREYSDAISLFEKLLTQVSKNHDFIKIWLLAARNLENRANASLLLLRKQKNKKVDNNKLFSILNNLDSLKRATYEMYENIMLPNRRKEIIEIIFGPLEKALKMIGK